MSRDSRDAHDKAPQVAHDLVAQAANRNVQQSTGRRNPVWNDAACTQTNAVVVVRVAVDGDISPQRHTEWPSHRNDRHFISFWANRSRWQPVRKVIARSRNLHVI
jgi:hypothetical protein